MTILNIIKIRDKNRISGFVKSHFDVHGEVIRAKKVEKSFEKLVQKLK